MKPDWKYEQGEKEKKTQDGLLFLNMQKQSEGTGLFALEMWW